MAVVWDRYRLERPIQSGGNQKGQYSHAAIDTPTTVQASMMPLMIRTLRSKEARAAGS